MAKKKVVGNPVGDMRDDTEKYDKERAKRMERDGVNETEILEKAKDCVNTWSSAFTQNLQNGRDDADFLYRSQWRLQDKQSQTNNQRLALEFNKLRPVVRKILAEQRKNNPELLVRSLNGKATQEEITLRADIIRSIAYRSQTELVYQQAFNSSLTQGFGAFQIVIDYESEFSFNKQIRYDLINDINNVFFDPAAKEPHKGDGAYCGRIYSKSASKFRSEYPNIANPVSFVNPNKGQTYSYSGQEEQPIDVAYYYDVEWSPFKLLMLSNGQTVSEDEWRQIEKDVAVRGQIAKDSLIVRGLIEQEMPRVVGERMSERAIIVGYELLDNYVIDWHYWPSKYLPIIFVDGDSQYIDGRQYTSSFINEAKDAQILHNYIYSEIASEVKSRRREQWIATPDNVKGNEQVWRHPESQLGVLLANPDPKTGMMPTKLQPWELSQSLMALAQLSNQDIREILGFSESEVQGSRDISGRAKRERRIDASQSTYVYQDNLYQAIAQGGRVVLDLLPVVYGDENRAIVLTTKNGDTKNTILNKRLTPENEAPEYENLLQRGDFDIEVDTGPSYAVQKDEALELMLGLVQASPNILPLIADLIASNLDIEQASRVEERLRNLVPPDVLAKEKGEEPPPPPPNPQEQMMQLEAQLKQVELQQKEQQMMIDAENHKRQAQVEMAKLDEKRAEIMLKMQQLELDAQQTAAKYHAENRRTSLNYQTDMMKLLQDRRRNF